MDIDARAALRLMQAVVTQAFVDATSEPKKMPTISDKVKRRADEGDVEYAERSEQLLAYRQANAIAWTTADRDEAREWLLKGGDSFEQIVSLAGYNPDDIREQAQKLARNGWPRRVKQSDLAVAA